MEGKKDIKESGFLFENLSELKRVFAYYDRQICYYNRYEWEEGITKEILIRKRDAFLELVKGLGNKELMLLYYVRHVRGISLDRLLCLLQNLYQAEQELYCTLQQKEAYFDPMKVLSKRYKNSR